MENKLNGYNMSEIDTYMEEILEFLLKTWKFVHACMDSLEGQLKCYELHMHVSIELQFTNLSLNLT